MTSNDGLKWNQVRLERSEQTLYDIAVLDDRLFTVGVDGGIKSLRDGASWEISGPRGLGELQQIIRQSGLLMAVGNGGVILASTDGLNWLRHESGTARVLFGVAFAQGRFLVVGEAGTCLQSGLLASP
jgi:photosystem II stability/assembly factor-like uncharacterized protein